MTKRHSNGQWFVHVDGSGGPHSHDGNHPAPDGHAAGPNHDLLVSVAYLAGPMRGIDQANFPAFDAAAVVLRGMGWTIFSPADNDRDNGYDGNNVAPDGENHKLFAWDLARILEASCVIVLPGWETSTGCHWEFAVAHATGKPVFQYPELTPVELPDVVKQPVASQNALDLTAPAEAFFVTPREVFRYTATDSRITTSDAQIARDRGVDGPGAYAERPGETRVVDPTSGGEKGQKATQVSTLDPVALDMLGRVGGMGAAKYDRYNYLKGYAWHLSFDAAMRHALAFWAGEDLDEESGLPHTAHAAWHLNALTSFFVRGIGTDDRPPRHTL